MSLCLFPLSLVSALVFVCLFAVLILVCLSHNTGGRVAPQHAEQLAGRLDRELTDTRTLSRMCSALPRFEVSQTG